MLYEGETSPITKEEEDLLQNEGLKCRITIIIIHSFIHNTNIRFKTTLNFFVFISTLVFKTCDVTDKFNVKYSANPFK